MDVTLINNAGIRKECPTGFSWSTMFLGFLIPLLRGDLIGMVIHILLTFVSVGIAWFVWPFMYNKNYINRLLEKGYIPYSEKDLERLKEIGIDVLRSYESQEGNEKEDQKTIEMVPPSEIDSGTADELPEQKTTQAQNSRSLSYTSPSVQRAKEPDVDSTVVGNYDFSDKVSLKWPVEVQSGTLMRRGGQGDREDLSCSVAIQNVQSREILYTEWQLKCFDILKKPILTEMPITIRHEAKMEPGAAVTVKSTGPLPPGTRSFTPYLRAVLYGDQTVEEYSDDELISVKPRAEITGMRGFTQEALEQYRQANNLVEVLAC